MLRSLYCSSSSWSLTLSARCVQAQRKMAPAYSTALPLTRFILRNPKVRWASLQCRAGSINDNRSCVLRALQGDGSSKEAEDALATQLRVVESGVNVTIRRSDATTTSKDDVKDQKCLP